MSRAHRKPKARKPVPASAYGPRDRGRDHHKLLIGPGDTAADDRLVRYTPGRLNIDTAGLLAKTANAEVEFAIAAVPAIWLVDAFQGRPATVCAAACLHLADVYTLLGIKAHILPVTVAIPERGGTACYGEDQPWWDGTEFVGHCIVDCPDLERTIDVTIQQFDGFQSRRYPVIGRTAAVLRGGSRTNPGSEHVLQVDGRTIAYTVAEGGEALVRDADIVRAGADTSPRTAANIAAQTLETLRNLGFADRIPEPFERLRALLDAIGETAMTAENGDFRFALDSGARAVDELLPQP